MKAINSIDITVAETLYVRLTEIELFSDNSGWCATIAVGAGEFKCTGHNFFFADPSKFLEDLRMSYQSLEGAAELNAPYEEEFLRFAFQAQGHVQITGLLRDYGGSENYFRYGIEADQTFIPPLIKSFERLLAEIG